MKLLYERMPIRNHAQRRKAYLSVNADVDEKGSIHPCFWKRKPVLKKGSFEEPAVSEPKMGFFAKLLSRQAPQKRFPQNRKSSPAGVPETALTALLTMVIGMGAGIMDTVMRMGVNSAATTGEKRRILL